MSEIEIIREEHKPPSQYLLSAFTDGRCGVGPTAGTRGTEVSQPFVRAADTSRSHHI